MFKFFSKTTYESPSKMASLIAREFRNGLIVSRKLDGHGISEMSILVDGVIVHLSWYSDVNNTPRSISIDGNKSIPNGVDSRHIFSAAIERSERLIEEDLAVVYEKLRDNQDTKEIYNED